MELTLPTLGWSTAVTPCDECLLSISKMDGSLAYAGQQSDCYDCHNRFTATCLADKEASIIDVVSTLGVEQVGQYVLVGVQFEKTRRTAESGSQWLVEHSLEGFAQAEDSPTREWLDFSKSDAPAGEHVFALVEPGVMGRFVLSSTPV